MFGLPHQVFPGSAAPAAPAPLRTAGFALVEVIVAVMLLTLTIIVSTQAMLQSNREAGAMRTMAAARGIVQRNIDTALSVTWDSTMQPAPAVPTEPEILGLTAGANYDDDGPLGNSAPNNVAIASNQDDATAAGPVLGTLTRQVTDVSTGGALLRQITITLNYTYRSRPYSIQMTTERAIDD